MFYYLFAGLPKEKLGQLQLKVRMILLKSGEGQGFNTLKWKGMHSLSGRGGDFRVTESIT